MRSSCEQGTQEKFVLKEWSVVLRSIGHGDKRVSHAALLWVDSRVVEHVVKSVLVSLVGIIARLFSLDVTNSEESL